MYGFNTTIEITGRLLEPAVSDCDCHGPYAHPVAVALDHQQQKMWQEWLTESLGDG